MTPAPSRLRGEPALVARDLHKMYPGIKAVDGVNLELYPGSVHGLVGVNGAGKSTVLKMLTGIVRPDHGQLTLGGEEIHLHSPGQARKLGIAAVHQEPSLVPARDAVSNVFLGQQLHRLGFARRGAMEKAFKQACQDLGLDVSATAESRSLPLSAQQQIEIIRALQHKSQVLVLDEPTAALGASERRALLEIIGRIRATGTAVLFISHHLEEVLEICDEITVLRGGKVAAQGNVGDFTTETLTQAIVGRSVGTLQRDRPPVDRGGGAAPLMEIRSLQVPGRLHIGRLEIRAGEVIGLAGLVGAGRSRLLRTIAGLESPTTGAMSIDGERVAWPASPRKALKLGIALAPEDRRTQGLVLRQEAWTNMTVSTVARPSSFGLLRRRAARQAAASQADAVNLASDRLSVPAGTLSGGNQQKVVLGRLLGLKPRILLVDEPMRGIDVGAREEIFRVIEAATAEGTAVIIASEETEDLLAFCDRVIVMRRGFAVAETSGPEDRDSTYAAMLGAPSTEPSKEMAS